MSFDLSEHIEKFSEHNLHCEEVGSYDFYNTFLYNRMCKRDTRYFLAGELSRMYDEIVDNKKELTANKDDFSVRHRLILKEFYLASKDLCLHLNGGSVRDVRQRMTRVNSVIKLFEIELAKFERAS